MQNVTGVPEKLYLGQWQYITYTILVLTVNIELMWWGLETGERLALPEKAIFRSVTVYYIYNIVVLTVNIELMWRGLEMGEKRALPEKAIFMSVIV
jgi:hypothetical protein